ncbi:sulfoxide reductase heme-binding subunit YedZ [Saccharophagus sp. K07]|uniref:sulfite oxidase heme-binding subunit YedZ n=1 Tax=Saccharophagus sp. K07 TaxID=2283636 RepID=UPI0016523332|nr:protein-methionine-sulfoxide reductase heme-binding subunit MsrQ [Saccharophagus sp. K07]MBC6906335.1 sulfoxide reductase heme-binding subunit YedZ [Saccharophagus sp. K07]
MPVTWRRIATFLLSLAPFTWLVWATLTNQLGADPAKTIVLLTGHYTFYFLLITLAVTPLRRLVKFRHFHFRWLQIHRRMLGLFTLFYALAHMTAFLVFILGLDFTLFAAELVKRPYILFTLPAIVLLILLGITSTKSMMRRLGKNWQRLHNSFYLIAVLAWLHVFMQVRSSYQDAVVFGIGVAVLLGIRLCWKLQRKA